jgi:uncharacterized OB-fold protein
MTVYTETTVHLAAPAFAAEAPYQVVIITRDDNTRVTGRVEGPEIKIGDEVVEAFVREGVPFFRKVGARDE